MSLFYSRQSFSNNLLSDEFVNIIKHLRKLRGSNHPLLTTAKNFLYNGKTNNPDYGLIVLLLSKAAGIFPSKSIDEEEKKSGILNSQRALAEITEMLRIHHLFHQGLLNLHNLKNYGNDLSPNSNEIFGNKVAVLGGDKILAKTLSEVAKLRYLCRISIILILNGALIEIKN